MTTKQKALIEKHGTLEQFERALLRAAMDFTITPVEAADAVKDYISEWQAAGEDKE